MMSYLRLTSLRFVLVVAFEVESLERGELQLRGY